MFLLHCSIRHGWCLIEQCNKGFNPSRADVETYGRILDRDQDGKITLKDIEELAVKYLVGESALN